MTTETETYKLSVSREFVAQHYLTVPDPGEEGEVHSHRYEVEIRFLGSELGEFGYLVDIDAVHAILEDLISRYQDSLLNELPEFEDLNPSVEHFARLFGDEVERQLEDPNPTVLEIRMGEDEDAWASHRRALQ